MSLVTYNLPGGWSTPLPASLITLNPSTTVFAIVCPTLTDGGVCVGDTETWTVGPWAEVTPSVTTGFFDVQYTFSGRAIPLPQIETSGSATFVSEADHTGSLRCEVTGTAIGLCTEAIAGEAITTGVGIDLYPVTLSITAGEDMLSSATGGGATGSSSSSSTAAETGSSSTKATAKTSSTSETGSQTTAGAASATSAKPLSTNSASLGKGVKLYAVGVVGVLAAAVLL